MYQPWQVRTVCLGPFPDHTSEAEQRKSLSEEILKMLMDPVEGHDDAQHDITSLVEVSDVTAFTFSILILSVSESVMF